MCRLKLLIPLSKLMGGISLLVCLCACNGEVIPIEATLRKGTLLKDAALISEGEGVAFSVLNAAGWTVDEKLKSSSSTRPDQIAGYNTNTKIPIDSLPSVKSSSITFNWGTTFAKVHVAVFKNPIVVANNRIQNLKDIVWYGNPVKSVNIGYKQGSSYVDGTKIKSVNNLSPGTYVWCAWVYDDLGINIIASTREIPFKVYQ